MEQTDKNTQNWHEKESWGKTQWLRDSGLKVNEAKTEVCLFHRNDVKQICIDVSSIVVKSSLTMNVIGVLFDSKMQWSSHVA